MGMPRPLFKDKEIVDLGAYIRSLTKAGEPGTVDLTPGNPRQGELLFRVKGCADCHSIFGKGGLIGPDLGTAIEDWSVTELAGVMWNHGPEMWRRASKIGMPSPTFNGGEMANVIAYVFYLKFAGRPGDAEKGQTVFQTMHCSECHLLGGKGSGPDLTLSQAFDTPFSLGAMLWNHAPKMEKRLADRNLLWPEFKPGQMADLYVFLNAITQ